MEFGSWISANGGVFFFTKPFKVWIKGPLVTNLQPYSASTSSKIPNLWTIGAHASEYWKRDLMAQKKDIFLNY